MNAATVISVAIAVIAAFVPLYAMVITFRQRTNVDWERSQADRIEGLVVQLQDCRAERRRLEDENLRLMRKLLLANGEPTERRTP